MLKNIYGLINISTAILQGCFYSFFYDKDDCIYETAIKLTKINGLSVKILQAISGDYDKFSKKMSTRLLSFTDHVEYNEADMDLSFVDDLRKEGITVNPIPINSGLIAVVFKGVDNDGKEYAIKVKRKNITEKLNEDMDQLLFIVTILNKLPYIRDFNLLRHYHDNKSHIFMQLDFLQEADNIKTFYECYEKCKYIKVPQVYKEFTEVNNNIVVMDFVSGKKIDEVEEKDKAKYAKLLSMYGLKSLIFNGIYHGDLHPGNLFFGDDEIILIDYGIIGVITKEERKAFYKFMKTMSKHRFDECCDHMFKFIIKPEEVKDQLSEEIKSEIKEEIKKFIVRIKIITKRATPQDLYAVSEKLSKYNLYLSPFFSKAQLAFSVHEHLTNYLSVDKAFLDLQAEILNLDEPDL